MKDEFSCLHQWWGPSSSAVTSRFLMAGRQPSTSMNEYQNFVLYMGFCLNDVIHPFTCDSALVF